MPVAPGAVTESTLTAAAMVGWAVAAVAVAVAVRRWRVTARESELVTRASHELRGPLAAMRLALSLALRTGQLSPARLQALDLELGRAALALDDLAGTGRGPRRALGVTGDQGGRRVVLGMAARMEVVELGELVRDCVEARRPAAELAGAELRAEWAGPPVRVLGDRLRLAQVIGNLLANAIEHGGGCIDVRGLVAGATARVEVTDGGPGLPAPVSELARRARAGRGGRGRGLAIASVIASAHGGRVASAPTDRGARLVLELPATGDGVSRATRPPVP